MWEVLWQRKECDDLQDERNEDDEEPNEDDGCHRSNEVQ